MQNEFREITDKNRTTFPDNERRILIKTDIGEFITIWRKKFYVDDLITLQNTLAKLRLSPKIEWKYWELTTDFEKDFGKILNNHFLRKQVFIEVLKERERQDLKFGKNRVLSPYLWNTILIEEIGEISRAIFENDSQNYETEIIQSMAVLLAMIESHYLKNQNLK